jgi:hypothetical protein
MFLKYDAILRGFQLWVNVLYLEIKFEKMGYQAGVYKK